MIQTIKSRINCLDYCKRVGIPVSRSGDRCVSPLRAGAKNKSSFVVYDNYFCDFGGDYQGDVIDLCALYEFGGDKHKAILRLAELVGANGQNNPNWVNATQALNGLIQRWHESLEDEHIAYLHSRGINDQTIRDLKIGFTGSGEPQDGYAANRISIPYWKNGYIYSYVARGDNPKYIKRRNDDLSDRYAPWGVHTLTRTDKPLVVAEGAFDALSFYQEGYPVLATMGGHFSKDQLQTILPAMRNYACVYMAFDADSPGASFTLDLARTLFLRRIPFRVAKIPRPYKDVSDYYAAGGSLDDLLRDAKDGSEVLFLATGDKDAFKRLARHAARYVELPELARLFNVVRRAEMFDDAWLSALQRQCEKCPSEETIANLVSKKHMLRYMPNIGFYEYDRQRGVWRRTDDTQIMAYIGEELGHWRTGAKLSSIIKLVKADNFSDEPFDRKPLFNFINGTLELSDPPVFREASPEDMCSIQASYPYHEGEYAHVWEQFVLDICGGDPMRAELLREMAGYILFSDCPFETIFVLQGDGANGKSVFLNTLQAVFGRENTSAISVTGICQDFQRIYLSTSLLNIATEIKANMAGAEEYLKQIASGETINACYKGQNYVQFNPRCKLIFAVNGQLRASDTSDGLARRLKIINFNQKFVEFPTQPNEHKVDTELSGKLLKELPAIFNWCLGGYLMLKRCRYFPVLEDEAEAKRTFREASNPLLAFVSDTELEGRISKNELYRMYAEWCTEAGHQKGSRTYFIREVKKVLPAGTQEVDTYVDGQRFRGFIFPVNYPTLKEGELL